MLSIWFEQYQPQLQIKITLVERTMPAWIYYRTFWKNLRRRKKKKSKHNLIILITEAAKALNTSWRVGLCAFAPCNVPSEILLATYHTSKHWQSFRAQGNHLLLHQILPDSCSRDHSFLNHSITTSRWFSYIQLYINLIFPVTEKIHHGTTVKGTICVFVIS